MGGLTAAAAFHLPLRPDTVSMAAEPFQFLTGGAGARYLAAGAAVLGLGAANVVWSGLFGPQPASSFAISLARGVGVGAAVAGLERLYLGTSTVAFVKIEVERWLIREDASRFLVRTTLYSIAAYLPLYLSEVALSTIRQWLIRRGSLATPTDDAPRSNPFFGRGAAQS